MKIPIHSRQAAALVLVHCVEVGVQVDQRHGAASEVPGGAENTPGQRVVTPDTWRHERVMLTRNKTIPQWRVDWKNTACL